MKRETMRKLILVLAGSLFSLAWACSSIAPQQITNLPAALVNAPYSAVLAPAGSWSYSGGMIPNGLAISDNRIAGTPSQLGTFRFVAAEQTATGTTQRAAGAFSLCVGPSNLTLNLSAIPNAVVGTAYSTTLKVSGGTAPYTWVVSSGALPPGITLSSEGVLSGTPTMAGQFNANVTVTDSSTFSCAASIAGIQAPTAQTASVVLRM